MKEYSFSDFQKKIKELEKAANEFIEIRNKIIELSKLNKPNEEIIKEYMKENNINVLNLDDYNILFNEKITYTYSSKDELFNALISSNLKEYIKHETDFDLHGLSVDYREDAQKIYKDKVFSKKEERLSLQKNV